MRLPGPASAAGLYLNEDRDQPGAAAGDANGNETGRWCVMGWFSKRRERKMAERYKEYGEPTILTIVGMDGDEYDRKESELTRLRAEVERLREERPVEERDMVGASIEWDGRAWRECVEEDDSEVIQLHKDAAAGRRFAKALVELDTYNNLVGDPTRWKCYWCHETAKHTDDCHITFAKAMRAAAKHEQEGGG